MIPTFSDSVTAEQLLMTLSAMAYAQPGDIASYLADPQYSTQGDWKIVWGPAVTDANLMYVVKNINAGLYAIVIRGTVTTFGLSMFFDLYEDLDVGAQIDWQYPAVSGAQIANGTSIGLDDLTSMTWGNLTLLEFLATLPAKSFVYVTGHSLGGCLATVLAPWLHFQLPQSQQIVFLPFTFAAPTAGNPNFASWYNGTFGFWSWRVYNPIDIVPMAWSALLNIENLYDQPGPACPLIVQGAIDGVNSFLTDLDGVTYAQAGGTVSALQNAAPAGQIDWFLEAATQHSLAAYLGLVGAPLVSIPNMAPECLLRPARRQRLRLAAAEKALAA